MHDHDLPMIFWKRTQWINYLDDLGAARPTPEEWHSFAPTEAQRRSLHNLRVPDEIANHLTRYEASKVIARRINETTQYIADQRARDERNRALFKNFSLPPMMPLMPPVARPAERLQGSADQIRFGENVRLKKLPGLQLIDQKLRGMAVMPSDIHLCRLTAAAISEPDATFWIAIHVNNWSIKRALEDQARRRNIDPETVEWPLLEETWKALKADTCSTSATT